MKRALAIALVLAACEPHEPIVAPEPAVPANAIAPSPPQPKVTVRATSLRTVDWGNLEYVGIGPSHFRLHDGRSELHEYMVGHGTAHTTDLWLLDAVGYGDIGGDGNEDAAVAISYHFYGHDTEHHALD